MSLFRVVHVVALFLPGNFFAVGSDWKKYSIAFFTGTFSFILKTFPGTFHLDFVISTERGMELVLLYNFLQLIRWGKRTPITRRSCCRWKRSIVSSYAFVMPHVHALYYRTLFTTLWYNLILVESLVNLLFLYRLFISFILPQASTIVVSFLICLPYHLAAIRVS